MEREQHWLARCGGEGDNQTRIEPEPEPGRQEGEKFVKAGMGRISCFVDAAGSLGGMGNCKGDGAQEKK